MGWAGLRGWLGWRLDGLDWTTRMQKYRLVMEWVGCGCYILFFIVQFIVQSLSELMIDR